MSVNRRRGATAAASNATIESLENRQLLADTAAPLAQLAVQPVPNAGARTQFIAVIYTDNVAVNPATIGTNDLTVTGPGGFTATPTLSNVSSTTPGPIITAVYTFVPPGGEWDTTDNGTYTVTLNSNQVKDKAGNAVAAGTLGTFNVNITPVYVSNGVLFVNGTSGPDTVTVNSDGTNVTVSLNGVDSVNPLSGLTGIQIKTAEGNDSVDVNPDVSLNTTIFGGGGSDTLLGGSGNDSIRGGVGDDSINGRAGNDTLRGGDGNDTVRGARGNDLIEPLSGGNDQMFGGGGNDTIIAVLGDNQLTGGAGNDSIVAGAGHDTIFAHDSEADTLRGTGGSTTAHVDAGLDSVTGISSVLNT